jgi:hypothetical protein
MRNPPEDPPCAECWPEALPENQEAILVFLPVCRQIAFDPGGRITGPDLSSIVSYIDMVVKENKKEILQKVLLLMKRVAIPAYVEGIQE